MEYESSPTYDRITSSSVSACLCVQCSTNYSTVRHDTRNSKNITHEIWISTTLRCVASVLNMTQNNRSTKLFLFAELNYDALTRIGNFSIIVRNRLKMSIESFVNHDSDETMVTQIGQGRNRNCFRKIWRFLQVVSKYWIDILPRSIEQRWGGEWEISQSPRPRYCFRHIYSVACTANEYKYRHKAPLHEWI